MKLIVIFLILLSYPLYAKECLLHPFKHNKIILLEGMYDGKPINIDTLKELLVFTDCIKLNDSTKIYKDYYKCDSCNKKLIIKADTVYAKKIRTIEMFLLRITSIDSIGDGK